MFWTKSAKFFVTGACYHDVEAEGTRNIPSSHFPANLTLSPFLESDDSIQGVVMLIKNMTLIRELEERQRPADHLNNLGEVAMGMAHEIRNPLGGIRGVRPTSASGNQKQITPGISRYRCFRSGPDRQNGQENDGPDPTSRPETEKHQYP